MPYKDKEKQRESNVRRARKFRLTEKYRNWLKNYRESDHGRKMHNKYNLTMKGRASKAKYRKTEKYSIAQTRFVRSDKGKLSESRKRSRYRARKRQCFTYRYPGDFHTICEIHENHCVYCKRTNVKLTEDHFIPLSKGGDDAWWNLVPACGSCNCRKRDRVITWQK